MALLPSRMNGVILDFAPGVNREVSVELLQALEVVVERSVGDHQVERLWISSGRRGLHKCPSRHASGNAVDISRVNGRGMADYYGNDPLVTEVVDALQASFESAPLRRENFGPSKKLKLGAPYEISGHLDHVHLSVSGDHAQCSGVWRRVRNWALNVIEAPLPFEDEVCEI